MEVLVVTVSDRASRGEYEDLSGPAIERTLQEMIPDVRVRRRIVADEREEIREALQEGLSSDVVLTTGGTGLSPRDVTPEVTVEFCDREVPGIAEYLRSESMKQTPHAILSRGFAGMKGTTLVVNFPGSVKAAVLCARLLAPTLGHALKMVKGEGHP